MLAQLVLLVLQAQLVQQEAQQVLLAVQEHKVPQELKEPAELKVLVVLVLLVFKEHQVQVQEVQAR